MLLNRQEIKRVTVTPQMAADLLAENTKCTIKNMGSRVEEMRDFIRSLIGK